MFCSEETKIVSQDAAIVRVLKGGALRPSLLSANMLKELNKTE